MIPVAAYRGEKVAVFGLGRSGLAAVRALAAGGAQVWAFDDDSRRIAGAEALGARAGAGLRGDFAAVVLSPGVPRGHRFPVAADRAGVPVIGEVDLFHDTVRAAAPGAAGPRIVGITGTNGKSTATSLAGRLLAEAGRPVRVGGNLGTPALALDPLGEDGVYVLELSSYQLDLASRAAFDAACLLNISPDHLDRHGGMEEYAAAKRKIFRPRNGASAAIVACDDPLSSSILESLRKEGGRRTIPVSGRRAVEGGVGARGGTLFDGLDGPPAPVADLGANPALAGRHNAQNAALAYAACRALGLGAGESARGFPSFRGLAHRLEPVGEVAGVRFVNDSKATNMAAAARALACYRSIYWIAGGRAKETDPAPLEPWLGRVRRAYLIGEAADAFAAALPPRPAATVCGTLDRAVAAAARDAAEDAAAGAVVLLSPACASFDQFRDFEARGERFRALVAALGAARP